MTTIWSNVDKPNIVIGGWSFNEGGLSFNMTIDPNTGGVVYFNGIGGSQIWTNINKA